ncbi:hypothetical protein [Enterococcus ureasiticus]|uniref:Uncharacterized protein n=1 Tax=Enterococcus ureasiticus TaxID=903984 RepID=A0A1E5GGR3_9ENTE|nr:hypothetical protein [Enterococcus ureasiticus]OEG11902.1 hypothetical protein BCR21_06615 [Enterococcus ureasiticus]
MFKDYSFNQNLDMEKSLGANTITYQDILDIKAYLHGLKEQHDVLHYMEHFLDFKKLNTSAEIQTC